MNVIKLTYFLMFGLLFCFACESNYNGGNYNEQTNSHDYENSDSQRNNGNQGVNQSPSDNNSSNGNYSARELWQKPKVVIDKMGDLTDKVVADIGAGPYGYFTIYIAENSDVQRIMAIDIDKEALQFIENQKITYRQPIRNRIETRLALREDPNLKDEEADIVLIVDTYMYFEDPIAYLKNLKKGLKGDGKLIIIEFKKRNTPEGPPLSFRTAIGKLEQDLEKAGYINIDSDDQTLEYQYIVIAQPGPKEVVD